MKKYVYFIAYNYMGDAFLRTLSGNYEITLDYKITFMNQVTKIETLIEIEMDRKNVHITNFKLLRIENE